MRNGTVLAGNTVVAAIVAVICVAVAAITGLVIFSDPGESTPAIATITGLIGPVIVTLLALVKIDRVDTKVDHVSDVVDKIQNGMSDRAERVVQAVESQTEKIESLSEKVEGK